MGGSVDQKKQTTHGRDTVPWILLLALVVGICVVLALGKTFDIVATAALVWGLALYVTGVLIGFLFGIPKVPDRAVAPASKGAEGEANADSASVVKKSSDADSKRLSGINSNLVEVSDWLTKIIVGVGLVELKQLPRYGQSLAGFIADSLARNPSATPASHLTSISGAIALFFGVLGFITGYLMTRIFLAIIMNDADRNAEEVSMWRLSGGAVVDTPTILSGLKNAVDDLQAKVVGLMSGGKREPQSNSAQTGAPGPNPAEAEAGRETAPVPGHVGDADPNQVPAQPAAGVTGQDVGGSDTPSPPAPSPIETTLTEARKNERSTLLAPANLSAGLTSSHFGKKIPLRLGRQPVHRLLWVDDIPKNNTLVADRLKRAGVTVQQVLTTKDALIQLERNEFDIVITDMSRPEGGDATPAGIRLVNAATEMAKGMPATWHRPLIFVYCGKAALARYGQLATSHGADFATASEVELLSMLGQIYAELLT